ncbi:MAG: DUF4465 domain-containing protein [Muribaculaceae bacterium]|nr:DUF4465 domain-containing protein [Muribaculaceae bacterium]
MAAGLSACNSNEDPIDVTLTYDFNFPSSVYNNTGYWTEVYNTADEYKTFLVSSTNGYAVAEFSHSASADEYEGVVYRSYTGFCPSRVEDTQDHSNENWVDYQWAAMARADGTTGYLIAHWDVSETDTKHSCGIEFAHYVVPKSIKVANTAWGYWAMKNGSAFSRPFGHDDRCTLTIHGVQAGRVVGEVSVDLAADGKILDTWKTVDLSSIGQCTGMYFTMTSTDTGDWGMNNPAYFAIDDLAVTYLGAIK